MPSPKSNQPPQLTEFQTEIKPGDDFFRYINQKWLSANPIPDDEARWGVFEVLRQDNLQRLHDLLIANQSSTDSPNTELVRRFFRSGMDEETIASTSEEFIKHHLSQINAISSTKNLSKYLANWHAQGLPLIWDLGIAPDDKASTDYALRFYQSGLGLPDRDYYFEKGERLEKMRAGYKAYLADLFQLLGFNDSKERAQRVYAIEHKLAEVSATATECRDDEKMYNKFSKEALMKEFADFNWNDYLVKLNLGGINYVLISQPAFTKAAIRLLNTEPLADWQSYLAVHTLRPLLTKLAATYEDLYFAFYGRVLSGAKQQEPRFRRVMKLSEHLLPEPTGQLFVESYFDETAKQAIYNLVAQLQAAFRKRINNLDWMSVETKQRALEKLDTFLPLLGYPDKWRDYTGLQFGPSYVQNFLAATAFEWQYSVAKIGKKVDPKEWLMSPAEVNAYYWPNTNGITFPAGILQPPFFYPSGDFATNYGAIGVVIGHEITHGFDDQGSRFDKHGNLNSWWSKTDRRDFDKRAAGLKNQYDGYEIAGRHVNGALTLGENIADLGGLAVAYDALLEQITAEGAATVDGLTPSQRFFVGYARTWCGEVRPELQTMYLLSDPHSPYIFRVNGIVRNMDAFYEAFDCQPGDQLYLAPEDRVRIW